MQFDATAFFNSLFDDIDEIQNITGGRSALIDNEIAVNIGDHSGSDSRAFKPQFVNQLTGGDGLWIFENTSRARGGWLTVPPFMAVGAHPLGNRFFIGGHTFEDSAEGYM